MRYNKQQILKEIGNKQKTLEKSTVTIIGLGAIGTNTASLLARSGVNLHLIDRDIIELDNLQRQTLFTEDDIDKPKALQAFNHLRKINSSIKISYSISDLTYNNINLLKGNLILDCTDNMLTRFLINDYSMKNKIPWIYSSVIGTKGLVFTIFPKNTCFSCLFKIPTTSLESCDTSGILNSAASFSSNIQVTEAIKILTKQDYTKELIKFDIWNNSIEKIKIKINKDCLTHNNKFPFLNGEYKENIIKICGNNVFQFKSKDDYSSLIKKLKNVDNIINEKEYSIFKNAFIFKDGRILVKASSLSLAKSFYEKYI